MGRKKASFTTTFPHEFVKEMKVYCAHQGWPINELIEKAIRDFMKRNPVK